MANTTREKRNQEILNINDVPVESKRKSSEGKLQKPLAANTCTGLTVVWDQSKPKVTACPETLSTENEFRPSKMFEPNWKRINLLTIVEFSSVYPFNYHRSKFKCFVCGLGFFEAVDMKTHVTNEHSIDEKKHRVVNPYISNKEGNYYKVDVSTLDCRLCTEQIPSLQFLKTHLKANHGKKINPDFNDYIVPFKLSQGPFDCQMCSESFHKWRMLVLHMNVHFCNYSCDICGVAFITMRSLRTHLRVHESGSFPCGLCHKIFSSASKRSSHRRITHENKYNRKCPKCPMLFNNTYSVMKHRQAAHGDPSCRYRCDVCDKEFVIKHTLNMHKRQVHLQERDHECSECHERFFTRFSLKTHMVKHTGTRNYQCEVCKKCYPRRGTLRQHLRIHTNDRRFVCAVCGQAFVQNCSLKSHIKSTHGAH